MLACAAVEMPLASEARDCHEGDGRNPLETDLLNPLLRLLSGGCWLGRGTAL